MSAKDEKQIWDFLKSKGLNDYAIAGVTDSKQALTYDEPKED